MAGFGKGVGYLSGYSLLELLVVTAIVAVCVGAGLSLADLVKRERQFASIRELQGLVHFARAEAVNRMQPVTLCALDRQGKCTRDWSGRDIVVFADRDGDRRPAAEEALRRAHWDVARGDLLWRAAWRRPWLEFTAMGATHQNGSFVLCHRDGDDKADLVLTINRGGRPYVGNPAGRGCR